MVELEKTFPIRLVCGVVEVGHSRESMMELTHYVWRYWIETHLAALRWNFSMELYLVFSVGIPDSGCILKDRSSKGFARNGFLLLPVKDWAVTERCKSCSDACLKGGHGQCLGCY